MHGVDVNTPLYCDTYSYYRDKFIETSAPDINLDQRNPGGLMQQKPQYIWLTLDFNDSKL